MSEPQHRCRDYHSKLKELTEEESLQLLVAAILNFDIQELSEKDDEGYTILSTCCQLGYVKHVEKLLMIPEIELRVKNKEGDEPIHVLCKYTDNDEIAKMITDRDSETLTALNREKNQPVHLAVMYGRERILTFLISRMDIGVGIPGNNGRIPLDMVINKDDLKIFKILYEHYMKRMNIIKDEDGNQPIHRAANAGAHNILGYLIDSKMVSLYVRGFYVRVPIHFAALSDKLDTVKFFLDRDPDLLYVKDDFGNLIIHFAAKGGAQKVLIYLIDTMMVSLYTIGQYGGLPIHVASEFDRLETVKFLIERNPDFLNMEDENGNQPIHDAATGGALNVIVYLIDTMMVSLYTRGRHGRLPIHMAAHFDQLETVKFFVERDPSLLNVRERNGSQPIHKAAAGGALNVLLYFIDSQNVSLYSKGVNGKAPIHKAAYFDQLETVKFFLERDPDLLYVQDVYGNQPIHSAAEGGAQKVLAYLIDELKVCLYTKGQYGGAPIHRAAESGQLETVMFFIERNPDLLSVHDDSRKKPLSLISDEKKKQEFHMDLLNKNVLFLKSFDIKMKSRICQELYMSKDYEMCKSIIEVNSADAVFMLVKDEVTTESQLHDRYHDIKAATRNEKESLVHFYARHGFTDAAQVAIDLDYDVNTRDSELRTPLLLAAKNGHVEMFRLLMLNGANALSTNYLGRSCLHEAAGYSHVEMVQTVLSYNSNVDCSDFKNRTPLMEAAIHGNLQIADLLIDKGADVNAVDASKNTVLCHAAMNKHSNLCTMLVKRGSNVQYLRRSDNNTVFAIIQENLPTTANELQLLDVIEEKENSENESWWRNMKEVEKVGNGHFGVVAKAVTAQGNIIALKTNNKDSKDRIFDEEMQLKEQTKNELVVCTKLQPHTNIVHMIDFVANDNKLKIAMEFVDGMNLKELMDDRKMDRDLVKSYAKQLLQALEYLHSHDIIHRDVKPTNMIVTPYHVVKLTDFGLAKPIDYLASGTKIDCCRPTYIAPEVWKGTSRLSSSKRQRFSHRVDIWSAGCVFFEMMTHKLPRKKVKEMRQLLQQEPCVTRETWRVFNSMLVKDWRKRSEAEELLHLPYFADLL